MFGYWGYNPSITNTVTGISAGLSIANGVLDGLNAKNKGASTTDAISTGIISAGYGVTNALFGNVIDKNTGTYAGSMMTTAIPSLTGGNQSQATASMFSAAFMSNFMRPMCGYPMMMGYPMMFSSPSFFMAPPMMGGGCCYYC